MIQRPITRLLAQPLTLLCACLLAGCGAGSGEGLDDLGLPVGEDPMEAPEPGTLAQLQRDIFSPICAQCHIGVDAPEGLRLDSEQNSYDSLVNQPSSQQPSVLRVAPGEPDQSYIVHKIEGRSGIDGGRMPLGMTPLSDTRIAQVRDWISRGAPREGTGLNATRMDLTGSVSTDGEPVLRIRFTRPVADDTLTDGLQVYYQSDEQTWLAAPDAHTLERPDSQTVEVHLALPDVPVTGVEMVVNDPSSGLILDQNRRVVDGDRDGQEGGEVRYELAF